MRKDAREAAYKILFGNLFNENDEGFNQFVFEDMKLSESDKAFAEALLNAVSEHRAEIEEIVGRNAKG